ncbi:MAG: Hsp20/alpha crystallin family protein [Phycisphaerae bacterium]
MSIIPWRQKRPERIGEEGETGLARLREEMHDLVSRFFGDEDRTSDLDNWAAGFGRMPRMDLAESADDVAVKVELPGVDPKEVNIEVAGNAMTITGERKQEKEEKKRDYHYTERSFGSFRRSIQLPSTVDAEKVDATFKNGVLTVKLAKRADAKPKRITVRSA